MRVIFLLCNRGERDGIIKDPLFYIDKKVIHTKGVCLCG